MADIMCKICGQIKPISEFRYNEVRVWKTCLSCKSKQTLEWKKLNPERNRQAEANWRSNHPDRKNH